MAFCVAWRDNGSRCPPQFVHRCTPPDTSPQYGHSTARGIGVGGVFLTLGPSLIAFSLVTLSGTHRPPLRLTDPLTRPLLDS